MCETCGCTPHEHEHTHEHDGHTHTHTHTHTHRIDLGAEILAKNDRIAGRNRAWLAAREIAAFNLMSAPGAGKTTLLERTLRDLGREVAVIEGDQATSLDADRIQKGGHPVVQINTGTGCHLDAAMVERALGQLAPAPRSLLFIENVGNLVCPALFDLGERRRVVILSVTEGDDKPLKYPHMFRAATALVLSKIDLLPHVPFELARCTIAARQVNPSVQIFPLSATRGDGLAAWYDWLTQA
jgi:hydrogenase nickel incorporation protein HypB